MAVLNDITSKMFIQIFKKLPSMSKTYQRNILISIAHLLSNKTSTEVKLKTSSIHKKRKAFCMYDNIFFSKVKFLKNKSLR